MPHQPSPHRFEFASRLKQRTPTDSRRPSTSELLGWFRACCHEEIPLTIHQPVVGRAPVQESHTTHDGAPAFTTPFEGYLAGSPWERDVDGSYRRPLRAALATMAKAHPLAIRRLDVLARVDADCARAAERLGWDPDMALFYFDGALRRLRGIYREGVSARRV
jgi:hypothetical protein